MINEVVNGQLIQILQCGRPLPTSYDSESECQPEHAMTMTYTTRETALAEREAAARQLDEGKLFVEMLVHRLDRAQKKLDMAEEQLDITKRLIASDATSLLVVKRLHEQGMPHNGFLIGQ